MSVARNRPAPFWKPRPRCAVRRRGTEPHAHGAQWGVVLDGRMELTIGDVTRQYNRGDTYYIPAGEVHSARFQAQTRVIDYFAEPNRYRVKTDR